MSVTVGAALKKVAVALLSDRRILKGVLMTVLVIVVAICMPMVAVVAVFSGSLQLDVDVLVEEIEENLTPAEVVMLTNVENTMDAIETAMIDAELPHRAIEAQVLYIMALYDYAGQPNFVRRLVSCFSEEQTDAQLISAVNRAFGTDIAVEDYTRIVANLRSHYLDSSDYVNPAGKNNLDLVTWCINAYESGWGYVMGTYGNILTQELYEAKMLQLPDYAQEYGEYVRTHWMGYRTADCIGLIKGYSWYDPETGNIGYATNGMPDVGADQMYRNATEKGRISTMPEIPGLAVWCEGHIGVYIGGGYAIEAMGTHYGVVKTRVSSRNWTHWLKIPYIEYVEDAESLSES